MARVRFKFVGTTGVEPSILVTLPPATENRYLKHTRVGNIYEIEFTPLADGLTHSYAVQFFEGTRTATRQASLTCQPSCQPVSGGRLEGPNQIAKDGESLLALAGLSGTPPFSYKWKLPAELLATAGGGETDNYVKVRGFTVGTHTLQVTISNGCGNKTLSLPLTVNGSVSCSLTLTLTNPSCIG